MVLVYLLKALQPRVAVSMAGTATFVINHALAALHHPATSMDVVSILECVPALMDGEGLVAKHLFASLPVSRVHAKLPPCNRSLMLLTPPPCLQLVPLLTDSVCATMAIVGPAVTNPRLAQQAV